MNTGNGTNPATPTIEVTDSATPRIALQNTRTRKVQCRGLTPKHKNVADNTLAVLRAMQAKPPFVPFGQKRVAWEAVANLIRTIPDLVHANGSLCETRYKQVRDEYVAAQAESRRATGIAEAPPTEQDQLLEDLIGLERDFDKKEQEEKQRQVDQAAQASQHQAHAEDVREAALASFIQPQSRKQGESHERRDGIDTPDDNSQPAKRRRRNRDNKPELDALVPLLHQALERYLSRH